MTKFEDGDLNLLLDRIIKKIDLESCGLRDGGEAMTFVTFFGRELTISCDLLLKIAFNDFSIRNLIDKNTYEIYALIHTTPLDRVPLFINTIPEVAKWRLEIGK